MLPSLVQRSSGHLVQRAELVQRTWRIHRTRRTIGKIEGNAMSYNCRCTDRNNCGKRKTLPRDPETGYIRIPKCPGCGKRSLRVDPSTRRQTINRTCYCRGVHFPHRRGTILNENEFCHANDLNDVIKHLLDIGAMSQEEIDQL